MPPNVTSLIRWCRYYGSIHPIAGVLKKMATYPITDLIWEGATNDIRETYREIFEEQLDIKPLLISIGMDYYVFGNSFISLVPAFKRFLVCSHCKKRERINRMEYGFKQYQFTGTCKACKKEGKLEIVDVDIKNKQSLKIVRWEPENIKIQNNPLSGRSMYLYKMPGTLRSLIGRGNKFFLEDTPKIFLNAAKKGYPVEFIKNKIFHFKRPTLAGKDMGWGEPLIFPVLKYLFYLQILMKHREALAQQGISPMKIIYPESNASFNSYETLNLGDWKTKVEVEVERWKNDPNRVSVFPVPVGYQAIGGEMPTYNTTPEVQQLMDDIIAGMQIPKSFYYGGATYTGTSAEFRLLENQFIGFQKQCLQLMNSYLIPAVSDFLGLPMVSVKFADLRVADDVQKKQLLLNLNAQTPKKISDSTLMAEFHLDAEKEKDTIREERKYDFEKQIQFMEDQAEAQGRSQIIAAKAQVKAQLIAQLEQNKIAKELIMQGYTQEELAAVMATPAPQGAPLEEPGTPANAGPSESEVTNLKQILESLPADQKDQYLAKLQRENPTLFSALMSPGEQPNGGNLGREASQVDTRGSAPQGSVDMNPLPTQKPPRRAGGGPV